MQGEAGGGGEQHDGDFPALGDGLEQFQLALDLQAGGVVGGGKELLGMVDQDQADAAVLVQDFGEGLVVGAGEGADGLVGGDVAIAFVLRGRPWRGSGCA